MKRVISIITICFASCTFANSILQLNTESHSSQWSRYYGGFVLGGQFGHSSDKTDSFGYNADNQEWSYNQSGLNTGLELGYNHQWGQVWIGPEIEIGYLDLSGNDTQPYSPGGDTFGESSSNFYTTLRARIGMDVNNYLLFITGGAIGARYTAQIVDNCNIAPCGGGTVDASHTGFVWGYTVGGGIEHPLAQQWSAKLEYLYFNLSNQSLNGVTNLGNSYDWTAHTDGNIIRCGLNYFFG